MKALKIASLVLSSIIITIAVDQYFFCPVYSFGKPMPFSGDSIYNPYASVVPSNWLKCNFHTHAHCWNGLTNGKGSANDIINSYSRLGYDIHAISNYQRIDTTQQHSLNFISCYEHGYNVLKSHQLVIGANKVCWKDYLLPQSLSNKQDILDRLNNASPGGLVVINHPMARNGYTGSDVRYLTRYSCMEVLSPICNSSVLWDECLSAGKPVFIIGNDDCHNIFDTTKVGRICTWINIRHLSKDNILQALKTGASYAMYLGQNLREEVRNGYKDSIPMLQKFFVSTDTVYAQFSLPAKAIIVSGANGHVLHTVSDTDAVTFRLGAGEPYARITANYKNGTEVFLNPVFRYHTSPLEQPAATVNVTQTLLLWLVGIAALAAWFGLMVIRPFIKKLRNKTLQNILLDYE